MKKLLLIFALIFAAMAQAQEFSLKLKVESFESPGMGLMRSQVEVNGEHLILTALSVRSFKLEPGQEYSARRAKHQGKDSFQIVTPDGKRHWFEVSGKAISSPSPAS